VIKSTVISASAFLFVTAPIGNALNFQLTLMLATYGYLCLKSNFNEKRKRGNGAG